MQRSHVQSIRKSMLSQEWAYRDTAVMEERQSRFRHSIQNGISLRYIDLLVEL